MPSPADRPEVHAELAAMKRMVAALDGLDTAAQCRVIRYLAEFYGAPQPIQTTPEAIDA